MDIMSGVFRWFQHMDALIDLSLCLGKVTSCLLWSWSCAASTREGKVRAIRSALWDMAVSFRKRHLLFSSGHEVFL